MESPDKKIEEISKEVVKLTQDAQGIVIKTQEDVATATSFLGAVRAKLKAIEEARTFLVKPLNDHVKEINTKFKEQSVPLDKIEADIKRSIGNYQLEQERIARVEEERLRKLRETADAKREEKGQAPIAAPVKEVARPDTTVRTEQGKTTSVKVWKYRVVDLDCVPRGFLRCEVNASVVNNAIKNGTREIAGLEIYEDVEVRISTSLY
jgi:uncharacterized protein YoxC